MKRGYLYLLITFFFWGSMYVASKYALVCIPPMTLSCLRQILSVSLIGIIAWRRGLRPIRKEHWKFFILIGVMGYALNGCFQFQAANMMNASLASLFNSTNPLFISFFAVVLLKETMTGAKLIGLICSFLGVCVILGFDRGAFDLMGVVFSFLSVLVWSLSCIIMRKISAEYSSEQVTFVGMLLGIPVCMLTAGIELQSQPIAFEGKAVLAVIYMAVFCSMLTNLLWNKSLKLLEASTCALFYPFQTLFSAILGILLLGERIGASFVIGAVLISAGVITGIRTRTEKQ